MNWRKSMATSKQVELLSEDKMESRLEEYFKRDSEIKELTKEQDEIKAEAREYAIANGTPDSKGSIKLELSTGKIQLIVRETIKLNQEKAIRWLTEHGMDDCIEMVPVVSEEKLEEKFKSGEISARDLASLLDRKSNTALYLKKPNVKESAEKEDTSMYRSILDALEV